jgi:hypothetical protein
VRVLPLTDHTLEIHLHDLFEQQPAIVLDMLEVENSRPLSADNFSELSLSLDEWLRSQVRAVQVEQVKRDEDTRGFSKQQILEDRPACSVNAGDLAVGYSVLHLQMLRQPGSAAKPRKVFRFRLTNSPLPFSRCTNARNPSTFSS